MPWTIIDKEDDSMPDTSILNHMIDTRIVSYNL